MEILKHVYFINISYCFYSLISNQVGIQKCDCMIIIWAVSKNCANSLICYRIHWYHQLLSNYPLHRPHGSCLFRNHHLYLSFHFPLQLNFSFNDFWKLNLWIFYYCWFYQEDFLLGFYFAEGYFTCSLYHL